MASKTDGSRRFKRAGAWLLLPLLVAAALLSVVIPVWLIQPFQPQTQSALEVAYALRRLSPVATLLSAGLVLALSLWLWRGAHRWWRKGALVGALLCVLAAAWFAQQNHFEWMFNPLAQTAYAKAGEADFVAGTDMVLAVEVNGEAAAYPIRLMAYHHLAQDVLGGTRIVATY
jgi:uncharacterized BrkB/YihY/UPF0761 family membrane protein